MVHIYSNDDIILLFIKFKTDRDLAYCHSLLMMIIFEHFCAEALRELVWGQRAQPAASKIDLDKLKKTFDARLTLDKWLHSSSNIM